MKKSAIVCGKVLFGLLVVLTVVFPIYMIVSNSFKPTLLIRKMPPQFFFPLTLQHYVKILKQGNFLSYFGNSFIIAMSTTVISIVLGSLAAYGLAIMKSNWGNRISTFLLFSKLVPTITIMIPLYIILDKVHLLGTYVGPILAHVSVNAPFVAWLVLGFIRDIPGDLFEAGKLDGCTRMQVFWKIVFPLLSPAIGSALLLVMQYSWNELLFSMQYTNLHTYTLTVGVSRFVGAISVDWGQSSAAATIVMVPIIIAGFFLQKYLVSGMTAGAVKG